MVDPPEMEGQAPQQGTIERFDPSNAGQRTVPESFIPVSQLGPLVQAHVGMIKAEIKSDLEKDLGRLPTRNEFWGAIVAGLIAAFGIFALMGDRIEHAVDRSSALTEKITRVENQGAENAKILEKISRDQPKPETSSSAKSDK